MLFFVSFLNLIACFSPGDNIFRPYVKALENLILNAKSYEQAESKKFLDYGFRIKYFNKYNAVFHHIEQNVIYKIYYGFTTEGTAFRHGEDLVRKVKSEYLCKIYDITNTTLFIKPNYTGVKYIKIIALEALGRPHVASTLYTDFAKNEKGKLNELKKIIKALVNAVNALHENDLIHYDIKPENILRYRKGDTNDYKLIDFSGVQKIHYQGYGLINHTYGYQAPEHDNTYANMSKASDIWSIGMTAFVLYTGINTYDDENATDAQSYNYFIKHRIAIIDQEINDPDLKNFIKMCLEYYPSQRPTTKVLLLHPFITSSSQK